MLVMKTKSCIKTSYILMEIIIPSTYSAKYAEICSTIEIFGCLADKYKMNDRAIGNIPINSFNSFHLINNIAEILTVYSLGLVHNLK